MASGSGFRNCHRSLFHKSGMRMSTRNDILKKLYGALKGKETADLPMPSDTRIFSDYPDEKSDLKALFALRLEQLHGEMIAVTDETEAASALYRVVNELPERSCLAHAPGLLEKLIEIKPALQEKLADKAGLGESAPEFAGMSAGITNADFLVARSGSIILSAATSGGRRLSVLPPLHIVLCYASQLVPSLDAAIGNLPESSYLTIITGPSRTSDIEKKLVLGAHGPKRLIVIMIG